MDNNSITNNEIDFDREITGWIDGFREAILDLRGIAARLAKLIESVPDAIERIRAKDPAISTRMLVKMLLFARGQLDQRLLACDGRSAQALAKMPIAQQQYYLENPVPLLVREGTGTSTLLVKVIECGPRQISQLFGNGGLRTLAEQRLWIEDHEQQTPKKAKEAYRVVNGKLRVFADHEFSVSQVSMILAEMTRR